LNYDIFLDLDKNIIEIKDENLKNLLNLCAAEKNWLKNIFKTLDQNKKAESKDMSWIDFQNIENEESLSFKGGEDWIRGEFHKYLKTLLVELDFFKALTTKKSESNPQSHKQLHEKIGEVKKKSAPFADSQNNILEGTDNNENSLEQISKKSKEQPEDTQEEIMVSEDDSVSREEIEAINDSIKLLKGYGIDWLLEWTKTPNFLFWLNNHNSQLHERSPNFGYTDNHFILSENGDIYVGEMVYGMKHGRGIFLERNKGFVYRGKWEYDKRNGEGSLTSLGTSDYLFDGEFKDNKKHGFGRLVTPHVKYAGHFVNDLFQGQGSLVDENQNIYEGEFREGLKEGMGKLFMKNGNEYAGEFKNGVYEGKGQLKIGKNELLYSGAFANGKRNGYGVQQIQGGEDYEGNWKNDLYHGFGVLKNQEKTIFEGDFYEGMLTNQSCTIKYPNGDFYCGEVKNFKPNGVGFFKSADGKSIEGEFYEGERIGPIPEKYKQVNDLGLDEELEPQTNDPAKST